MTTRIRAAVVRGPGKGVTIEQVPGPGEVLVQIRASGVCHTDVVLDLASALPAAEARS